MRGLSPGLAVAPVRAVECAPALRGGAWLPAHSRVGMLERLLLEPEAAPEAPCSAQAPYLAYLEGALDAALLLALYRDACRGVLLGPGAALERHALGVAVALGLPMARLEPGEGVEPGQALRLWVGPREASLGREEPGGWGLARRVLPWTALGERASGAWLEVVSAQEEELCHLLGLLEGGQAQGVGLLRLEYLCYQDPGLDEEGLAWRLGRVLAALKGWPVALRLADWGPEKPPPEASPLARGWSGGRGPKSWAGTPGLAAQLGALGAAVRQSGHARVQVVAPFVEGVAAWEAAQAQVQEAGLGPLGVMLESAQGLGGLEHWRARGVGLWLGLGDLSQEVSRVGQEGWGELGRALSRDEGRWWVCGEDAGVVQRLISGTLM